MVFQPFSKNHLDILIEPLFVTFFPVCPVIFFNLNETLLLLSAEKSLMLLLSSKVGSSLYYCHKLPDVFEQISLCSIKFYIGSSKSIL